MREGNARRPRVYNLSPMHGGSDDSQSAARDEYGRRLAANRAAAAAAAAHGTRLSHARLGCFGLLVAVLAGIGVWNASGHWLWPPVLLFVLLVVLHARVSQRRQRAEQAAALYEDGLARLDDAWAGRGSDGHAWRPQAHLYADDLDLFGRGSLFELLCAARTPVGQKRLADWLLAPADPHMIRDRQSAVEELRPAVDFREDLALVEGEVATALEHGAASPWGRAPARLASRLPPWLHLVAGCLSATLLSGWLAAGWNPLLMLAAMAVQGALAAPLRREVQAVLEGSDRPAKDLALLGRVLERIERARFEGSGLRALQHRLLGGPGSPSRRIRRLTRLADFVEARLNQIFLPLSWLFSIGTQLAFAIEAWRAENGPHLDTWVDVAAELEALASLSGYAYEHPEDPFPEIVEDECVFSGTALGHPLLPGARCVPNDVHLAHPARDGVAQALVVSGSNMSGKSTLLRTAGVNAVLAMAGAPVRAAALRISPLGIGASIRVQDSLQQGASRFYAEIGRLKQVVDLGRDGRPTLFLLDEILHGTNSHDRRIGAEAVVRALLDQGALGLVTTHDLALAAMADASGPPLGNVHFEDHMQGDRIAFDYILKPGVVTHSNALALMRAVGLDVEDKEQGGR